MAALGATDRKVQRCVWLALILTRKARRVTYPEYETRFGATIRTYQRDLSTLRRVGFTIVSERDHTGNVRCTGVAL